MSLGDVEFVDRADALRFAFDRSFAELRIASTADADQFLAIRVAGERYLLRLSEIAGIYADKTCTPLPSQIAEMRGLTAIRGAILPVYDLAGLLSYPPAAAPRWLAVAAGQPVAFAFDTSDGHFRCRPDAVAASRHAGKRPYIREFVRNGDTERPVIHIPSVIAAIRVRLPAAGPTKEQ